MALLGLCVASLAQCTPPQPNVSLRAKATSTTHTGREGARRRITPSSQHIPSPPRQHLHHSKIGGGDSNSPLYNSMADDREVELVWWDRSRSPSLGSVASSRPSSTDTLPSGPSGDGANRDTHPTSHPRPNSTADPARPLHPRG